LERDANDIVDGQIVQDFFLEDPSMPINNSVCDM
jgi:hypothetical protein